MRARFARGLTQSPVTVVARASTEKRCALPRWATW